MTDHDRFIASALRTIDIELRAIGALSQRMGPAFAMACERLLNCSGRIIVTGMGKSGHIASKIAATLSSTGSPAFFVHPAEASHGDLGMITEKDVVLALSNSGTTSEILAILPILKRKGITLISMTGAPQAVSSSPAALRITSNSPSRRAQYCRCWRCSTTVALVLARRPRSSSCSCSRPCQRFSRRWKATSISAGSWLEPCQRQAIARAVASACSRVS